MMTEKIDKLTITMKLYKNYDWILFDADNTLFHFDDFTGLQQLFARFGIEFSQGDYHEYQKTNKPLWVEYQDGKISANELQQKRFNVWANKLNVTTEELNNTFLTIMAATCPPLAGAESLLTALKGKVKLGIVTNGFTGLHQSRLRHTGFEHFFDLLVVSEEAGFAKPDQRIFQYAFERMNRPDVKRVLMVGDTLESDIQGGINAGLDTCWLNMHAKPVSAAIAPKYQVACLAELESLLLGKSPIMPLIAGRDNNTGTVSGNGHTTRVWRHDGSLSATTVSDCSPVT